MIADVNPAAGSFRRRPIGSVDALLGLLASLRDEGVIDDVVPVDATPAVRREGYARVFAHDVPFVRDYRGAPILNYLIGLTRADARYVVHADGDMLIHQSPASESWVTRGLALLRENPDIGAVLPLPGPPHPEGVLHQPVAHEQDPRGFFRFDSFTSRIFLVDTERLAKLWPLSPAWPPGTPPGRRLRNVIRTLSGESTLPTWEDMMGRAFRAHGIVRADLSAPDAWSLHPLARGDAFVMWLPRIVADVEAGRFPASQGGHYDLRFDDWIAWYGTQGIVA